MTLRTPPLTPTASREPFFARLVVGVLLLDLFVVVLAGLSIRQSWTQYRDRAAQSSQNLARVLAEEIASDVGKTDAVLLDTRDDAERQIATGRLDAKATDMLLARRVQRLREVASLGLTDASGSELSYAGARHAPNERIADADFFTRARTGPDGRLLVAAPVLSTARGHWTIPVARRVSRPDGTFAGIAHADIALDHIMETFSELDVGKRGAVTLLDSEGKIMARRATPDTPGPIGKIVANPVLRAQLRAGQLAGTYIAHSAIDGIERTFSYRKLEGYPLYVVVGLATSDYLFAWRGEAAKTAVLVTMFLAITMVFSWLVHHSWQRRQFAIDSLHDSQQQLRLSAKVFEGSNECIMITDANERILSVNDAFTAVTGFDAAEAVGRTPRMLSSGLQSRGFYSNLWHTVKYVGHWQGEIWNKRKDGRVYPSWLSISAVRDAEDRTTHYIGICSDISERKEAEKRIQFLAYHDALTGLPNRLLAVDHFELAVAHAERSKSRAALAFLDLDKFKSINDSLGHTAGDAFLKAVGERLRECVRSIDTVSRLGGDEFLIVFTDVRELDLIGEIAETVLEQMASPFTVEGQELSSSVSMGIALYPDDGRDFDTLLNKADTAMYHAKQAGRNTYRFHTEQMNVDALEHLQLRNSLRKALERGEFVLHFQPQVDLASGAVIGAEALIRWQHPELGLLAPGRFIPIAEDSALIVPIGEWVLRESCRQAVAWHHAGWPDLTVAVNLSAVQFRRGDLEKVVAAALLESGLDPAHLELELTESTLIQDTEHALLTLNRLKAVGVALSIDDFGTGYSSLSYIKRFAVDKLKIDQSFVRDMADDPNDAAIVRAIIQMARSLNLRTVAEGVEDERTQASLRLQHCDAAQGFHFARGLPADEFLRHLTDNCGATRRQ